MEQYFNMLIMALLSMSPAAPAKPSAQIENWPALKVNEHLVASMPSVCGGDGTGCTVINFSERTCDIYIAWREPRKEVVREREMKRCRGRDEPPFRLKTAYKQWSAGQQCKCKTRKDDDFAMVATAD